MAATLTNTVEAAIPITPLALDEMDRWIADQPAATRRWLADTGWSPEPDKLALLPNADGELTRVLIGTGNAARLGLWSYAELANTLPVANYRFDAELVSEDATLAALGWALGSYTYTRYRACTRSFASLVWPPHADCVFVTRAFAAITLVRDLVNTPSTDMGPGELADAARDLAQKHGAECRTIVGDALLEKNYPMVHAVGRASTRAPRLIDLTWGDVAVPKVTLVGKGVCFDTGGLNLKTSANMKLQKKDMGGAAHVLGLAHMIMDADLPVRLRVLIPAVDNSVAGNALRPLDVLPTRKGLTVEIGNTDAEGRLILCDALAEADREKPALLIDCATLTGAARIALGPDLPVLFSNNNLLAADLVRHAEAQDDPVWRLPLWQPYARMLDSKIADLNNMPEDPFAGSIVAALFLERFIEKTTPWAHLDIFPWNPKGRPGRPEGGEAVALRAIYALVAERFTERAVPERRLT